MLRRRFFKKIFILTSLSLTPRVTGVEFEKVYFKYRNSLKFSDFFLLRITEENKIFLNNQLQTPNSFWAQQMQKHLGQVKVMNFKKSKFMENIYVIRFTNKVSSQNFQKFMQEFNLST